MGLSGGQQEGVVDKPQRRPICQRCSRPARNACICASLPDSRLQLLVSHCIVLVHPLEARQSTRSLPFVELCLDAASLSIETGRRFADDSLARRRMIDSTDVWLMYPDDACAMSIQDAWHQRMSDNVTVVFLDATWQVRRW
jgi:DTW domain-containing protein YfiP